MPKVKVNDINMYYEIHGEGFPIVLMQGAASPHDLLEEDLIKELSKKYKIILFDYRGIGLTDKPDMKYSMKMFAEDVIGLLDALKIDRAHMLGISMGGMVAQEIALNYPDRVEKMVLCATSWGLSFSTKLIFKLFNKIIFFALKRKMKTPESVYDFTIPQLYTEEYIKENQELIEKEKVRLKEVIPNFEEARRHYEALMKANTRKRLKSTDTPTLILQGKRDKTNSYKNSLNLAEQIPYAKLALFENSPHQLFTEEVEKVMPVLLEFLG